MKPLRLVQLRSGDRRALARVDEPLLRPIIGFDSMYDLAWAAAQAETSIPALLADRMTGEPLNYDDVYAGRSPWTLLPPLDHPVAPARCRVSGTGLTHLGSAADRQAMHVTAPAEETDSMRIFRWGVEAGRPAAGAIGVAPEWFHKGDGTVLRGHGAPLDIPCYAEDGGEEAEVAGLYLIGPKGHPLRIGLCIGNEFSDHRFEKRNYLNLAGSKLRSCALGPEVVIDPDFRSVPGTVAIERGGTIHWSKQILTGEAEMCHNLQNLEHHHFKYALHRQPGDVHVHFFGACSLSFGHVSLETGDVMSVSFDGFGRALRNPVVIDGAPDHLVTVQSLA